MAQLQKGENDAALEQLRAVLALNPGNEQVSGLITQIEGGATFEVAPESSSEQIEETESVVEDGDTVTTTEAPDTSLIVPVNTVTEDDEEAESAVETTSEEETATGEES